jgi:hypothetical protein
LGFARQSFRLQWLVVFLERLVGFGEFLPELLASTSLNALNVLRASRSTELVGVARTFALGPF